MLTYLCIFTWQCSLAILNYTTTGKCCFAYLTTTNLVSSRYAVLSCCPDHTVGLTWTVDRNLFSISLAEPVCTVEGLEVLSLQKKCWISEYISNAYFKIAFTDPFWAFFLSCVQKQFSTVSELNLLVHYLCCLSGVSEEWVLWRQCNYLLILPVTELLPHVLQHFFSWKRILMKSVNFAFSRAIVSLVCIYLWFSRREKLGFFTIVSTCSDDGNSCPFLLALQVKQVFRRDTS